MSSVTEIRHAIAGTLRAGCPDLLVITGPTGRIMGNTAIVKPGSMTPQTMGMGIVRYEFIVEVLAGSGALDVGQDALDALLDTHGDGSIIATLRQNRTIGLTDVDVAAIGWDNYGIHEVGDNASAMGADVGLIVAVTRSS